MAICHSAGAWKKLHRCVNKMKLKSSKLPKLRWRSKCAPCLICKLAALRRWTMAITFAKWRWKKVLPMRSTSPVLCRPIFVHSSVKG
ncbi:Uncharacterised protein [Vibrio cholerae]|nr:Uncharacterised protein [Vibrio cholerae]